MCTRTPICCKNYFTDRGEVVSSDYILNNIELEGSGDKAQTTYDGLVLKLVSLEQQVASSQIDRQFQEEILQSFRNVDFGGTGEQHAKMESMINDYEAQLKSYYKIINTSSKELNLYISADYLKMISSVQVAAAINVKLYLMLALVLFFVIGCCGAILLGRISDAVDYLLYVDKKTGLPNREKLNVYITGMADRILPEDYTCFALQLDNLTEMSRRFGYHVGDGILKDFSGLLQLMGDTDGTVGYNGAGKFLAFFDECSTRKAEVMIRILQSQVDEYNKAQPGYPILFTAAWATTSGGALPCARPCALRTEKDVPDRRGGAALSLPERSAVKHDPEPTRLPADPLPHPQPSAGGRCRRVRRSLRPCRPLGCTICCTGAVPRCRTAHRPTAPRWQPCARNPTAEETCPLLPPQDPAVTPSVIVPVYNGEALPSAPVWTAFLQQGDQLHRAADRGGQRFHRRHSRRAGTLPGTARVLLCNCSAPAAPPPPATRDCATPWALADVRGQRRSVIARCHPHPAGGRTAP